MFIPRHVSHVTCLVSSVKCHTFLIYKVVELVGRGSVINGGAYPVYFSVKFHGVWFAVLPKSSYKPIIASILLCWLAGSFIAVLRWDPWPQAREISNNWRPPAQTIPQTLTSPHFTFLSWTSCMLGSFFAWWFPCLGKEASVALWLLNSKSHGTTFAHLIKVQVKPHFLYNWLQLILFACNNWKLTLLNLGLVRRQCGFLKPRCASRETAVL